MKKHIAAAQAPARPSKAPRRLNASEATLGPTNAFYEPILRLPTCPATLDYGPTTGTW